MGKNPRGMGAFSKKWRRWNKIKPDAVFNLDANHPLRQRRGHNPYVFHFTNQSLFMSKVTDLKPAQSSIGYSPVSKALARIFEEEKTLCPSSVHPVTELFKKIGITNKGENLVYIQDDLDKLLISDLIKTVRDLRKKTGQLENEKKQIRRALNTQTKKNNTLQAQVEFFTPLSKNKVQQNSKKQKELKKELLQQQSYVPPISIEFARHSNVLTDECVNRVSITDFFDKHFAHTRHLSKVMPKGTKDPEVVKRMLQRGIGTIVTYDKKNKSDKDLCFIANEIFEKPGLIKKKYGVPGVGSPIGVIVLPNYLTVSETKTLLSNNQFAIANHIARPQQAVLDLR